MGEQIYHSIGTILKSSLSDKQLKQRKPRLSTGFDELDAKLGGGISSGLIILGAGPSTGKSTFALQIASTVAARESKKPGSSAPVLYFSLEMKGDRIAAKMMSRHMFLQNPRHTSPMQQKRALQENVTADDMFQKTAEARVLQQHHREYQRAFREIGKIKDLYIFEGHFTVDKIVQCVRDFYSKQRENAADFGEVCSKPLVIVDYLQLLDGRGQKLLNDKQVMDYNVERLKALADGDFGSGQTDDGFPVLLISSLNRSSYGSENRQSVQMNAFKESGIIEYSADILLGLQFAASNRSKGKKSGFDLDEEKLRYPRNMEVKCLKNRYGQTGWTVGYRYYSPFDHFEELGEKGAPGQQESPVDEISDTARTYLINCQIFSHIRKMTDLPSSLWREFTLRYVQRDAKGDILEGAEPVINKFRLRSLLTRKTLRRFLTELMPQAAEQIDGYTDTDQEWELSRTVSEILAKTYGTQDAGDSYDALEQMLTDIWEQTVTCYGLDKSSPQEMRAHIQNFRSQIVYTPECIRQTVEELTPELSGKLQPGSLTEQRLCCQLIRTVRKTLAYPQKMSRKIGEVLCSVLEPEGKIPIGTLSEPLQKQLTEGAERWKNLSEKPWTPLSCYDCDVLDAVYTLIRRNPDPSDRLTLTPVQIQQALTGEAGSQVTENQIRQIWKSLEKLSSTEIWMDTSVEYRTSRHNREVPLYSWIKQGPLLCCSVLDSEIDLEPISHMPLFAYLKWNLQEICIPEKMLSIWDVKDGALVKPIRNEEFFVRLKRFLLHRLEVLRTAGNPQKPEQYRQSVAYGLTKIPLDAYTDAAGAAERAGNQDLMHIIGLDPSQYSSQVAWDNRKKNVRNDIRRILDFYKYIGYISRYKIDSSDVLVLPTDNADPATLQILDDPALSKKRRSSRKKGTPQANAPDKAGQASDAPEQRAEEALSSADDPS